MSLAVKFSTAIVVSLLLAVIQQSESCASRRPTFDENEACKPFCDSSEYLQKLFEATTYANVSVVRCLILKGVNVSGSEVDGFTPLQAAVSRGNVAITRMLIDAGAKVNIHDSVVGLTPLHYATEKNFVRIAKLLLDSGANVNATSKLNYTALHMAVTKDHKGMVELLLESDADINAKDVFGNTPLHTAAYRGHLSIVKLLVQKGADLNAETNAGLKPVDLSYNHHDVYDWLSKQ